MKMLKKVLPVMMIVGLVLGLGFMASPALAIDIPTVGGISSDDDVPQLIVKVIQWILIILGSLALLFLIIGGLRYVISMGDENAIAGAKKTIIYAIVGLGIALVSYVILAWLNNAILS